MDYALALGVLYNSNSLWALAADQFSLSCFVLGAVCAAYYGVCVYRDRVRFRATYKPVLAVMLFTLAGQFVLSMVHGDRGFVNGLWFQYLLILPLLFGCLLMRGMRNTRTKLFPRIVRMTGVLACISIVFWVLGSVLHVEAPVTTQLNWTDGSAIGTYWGLHYNVQSMTVGDTEIWRNSSIFSEPLLFGGFCGMALAMDCFVCRRNQLWCDAAMVIALLLSTSTGAYVFLIMFGVLLLVRRVVRARHQPQWRFNGTFVNVMTVVAIMAALTLSFVIAGRKITDSYSGQVHYSDFVEGLKIWADRPIFGFGFDADDYIFRTYMSGFRGGMAYTSGLVFMLIRGGLVLLLYVLVPWLLLVFRRIDRNQLYYAVCIMFWFVIATTQNTAMLLLCLAYGYACGVWRRADVPALGNDDAPEERSADTVGAPTRTISE